MFKLIPDFRGGFLLVEDYAGEIGGSLVFALIIAFFIGAPLTLFLIVPEAFTLAMACFGLCLILLLFSGTLLSFLMPLALPIFSYGLASTCNALLANSKGELLIFMYLIIALIILIGNAAIWGAAGGELLAGFSLVPSVIMWISCCGSTMEGNDGTWNYYLLKFLWIAAAIGCIYMFIKMMISFFKGKGQSILDQTISLAAGAAVGLILLFAAFFLSKFIHNWAIALFCLLLVIGLYTAGSGLTAAALPSGSSAAMGVVLVLTAAGTAWMLQNSSFNVRDIIIPEAFSMLKNSPINHFFAGLAAALPAYSSYLISSALTGLIDLIAHFFDASSDLLITCSEALAMCISLAVLALAGFKGLSLRTYFQKWIHS